MTNQDTTSIDELISNLTCATHFLTEEDCIYCDRKKIKALISDQVAKELHKIADFDNTVKVFLVTADELDDREPVFNRDFVYIDDYIATLNGVKK